MTKTRLLVAALLAVTSASAGYAQCSGERHVMSCAEGFVYDSVAKACVQQLSG
ncbi:hypothetical protein [Mesobacterium pallidum]|uniref:hypothetical protein n=1 Tax=Mesobacterium pallidum TaxID=2872037 RepID=UPI001EE36F6C|nr:hypothetical protein [Mesobacterium pallidum]